MSGLIHEWVIPQTIDEAHYLACLLVDSRLSPVRDERDAFLLLMHGASLGLSPVAALTQIHVIDGKPTLSAAAIAALCLRSGLCEYVEIVEESDTHVVVETKRKGAPRPQQTAYTIEQAGEAGLLGKRNWQRHPREMLYAAASRTLLRRVYPDVVGGIYDADELEPRDQQRTPAARALEQAGRTGMARLIEAGRADSPDEARALIWDRALAETDGREPDAADIGAAVESILLDAPSALAVTSDETTEI